MEGWENVWENIGAKAFSFLVSHRRQYNSTRRQENSKCFAKEFTKRQQCNATFAMLCFLKKSRKKKDSPMLLIHNFSLIFTASPRLPLSTSTMLLIVSFSIFLRKKSTGKKATYHVEITFHFRSSSFFYATAFPFSLSFYFLVTNSFLFFTRGQKSI